MTDIGHKCVFDPDGLFRRLFSRQERRLGAFAFGDILDGAENALRLTTGIVEDLGLFVNYPLDPVRQGQPVVESIGHVGMDRITPPLFDFIAVIRVDHLPERLHGCFGAASG